VNVPARVTIEKTQTEVGLWSLWGLLPLSQQPVFIPSSLACVASLIAGHGFADVQVVMRVAGWDEPDGPACRFIPLLSFSRILASFFMRTSA